MAIQKLLQALEKSLEHEKIMSTKCTTLTSELDKSTSRLKEMSATYEQDKRTIALLKQDNEKAWASVDEGKEREKVFASSTSYLDKMVRLVMVKTIMDSLRFSKLSCNEPIIFPEALSFISMTTNKSFLPSTLALEAN